MTALAPTRVGWCPGALRPMATGDGLLVRLKPRGGILPIATASAIAALSRRHGNGVIDLTARANLQIRGVDERTLPPLLDRLDALGLVDADPDAEAVRNVVASPLAGLGPSGAPDACAIAAAIETLLEHDTDLWRLPAKWGFVVDDGGPLSLRDVAADIRFEALTGGSFGVGLAEEPTYAACSPEQVVPTAAALCRVALATDGARMADLVRQKGAPALFHAAGLEPAGLLPPRNATASQDVVGHHRVGNGSFIGVAPPFGTLQADDLRMLAERAGTLGARDLRLTPWRVLLIAGLDETRAATLAAGLPPIAWITRPDDARLAVAACAGGPACHRGSTPVQGDAARVADDIRPWPAATCGIAVHVSGCAKGCAHPHPARVTLVGRDGAYDLVLNGKAGDKPVETGLPLDAALRRIGADAL